MREGERFEPDLNRGAVARATLYFLVRYPGLIGNGPVRLDPDAAMSVLLAWHETDPPSVWERHRNQAIAAAQGTRNPFVDHPEWACATDFRSGFAASGQIGAHQTT